MIRIDAVWIATEPADMRAGADRLLARVVQVFGAAQAHHGYLFKQWSGPFNGFVESRSPKADEAPKPPKLPRPTQPPPAAQDDLF